jgi:hypothetical protein
VEICPSHNFHLDPIKLKKEVPFNSFTFLHGFILNQSFSFRSWQVFGPILFASIRSCNMLTSFILASFLRRDGLCLVSFCPRKLKGHGNEADFRGFCINRFSIGPLHYISSRSDFGFEFAEIFIIENDSLTCRFGESPTHQLAEFSFKHSKADSMTPRVGESATPCLIMFEDYILNSVPFALILRSSVVDP